jgi:hypothetical protein
VNFSLFSANTHSELLDKIETCASPCSHHAATSALFSPWSHTTLPDIVWMPSHITAMPPPISSSRIQFSFLVRCAAFILSSTLSILCSILWKPLQYNLTLHTARMEGLGIAANFIAVINQTVILSEAIYKYVQSIRRRRKIAQAFGEEVMLFLHALEKLEDVVKRVEKERLRTDNRPLNEDSFMNATAACKRTLLEILNKLPEKRTVNLPLLGKVKVALKWPFDEKEMDATLKKLQGHQQSFVIQLGARTL